MSHKEYNLRTLRYRVTVHYEACSSEEEGWYECTRATGSGGRCGEKCFFSSENPIDLARHELHHEDDIDGANTTVSIATDSSTDTDTTQPDAADSDSSVSTAQSGEQSSSDSASGSVLESINEEFDGI